MVERQRHKEQSCATRLTNSTHVHLRFSEVLPELGTVSTPAQHSPTQPSPVPQARSLTGSIDLQPIFIKGPKRSPKLTVCIHIRIMIH